MGTNFYAHVNYCEACERYDKIHIGKSSVGWKFGIEIHELYYKTFNEFIEFLRKENVEIWNEYGENINFDSLMKLIEAKKDLKSHFDEYPEGKYANCDEADLHGGEFS